MPLDIYEDLLDIEVDTLVQEIPSPGEPWECYPYPLLQPTGKSDMVSLRTVVLENDFVKATILVDLGGRLLYLLDKRTGIDVLPRVTRLTMALDGHVAEGLLAFPRSRAALSPVDFTVEDTDASVAIHLHEVHAGTGVTQLSTWRLAGASADLSLSLLLHSRFGESVSCPDGMVWEDFYDSSRDAGLQILTRSDFVATGAVDTLATRLVVRPLSGLGHLVGLGRNLALGATDDRISVLFAAPGQTEAYVETSAGQTLKASLDSRTTNPLRFDREKELGGAVAFRVEDVEWRDTRTFLPPRGGGADGPPAAEGVTTIEGSNPLRLLGRLDSLETASRSPGEEAALQATSPRAQRLYRFAQQALRDGDLDLAQELLQDSLAYDANQVMTWWLLSRVQRLKGEDDENTRLNAHYLSPQEPLLRSEAYFAQPISEGKEPHPLLAPLKTNPEALMDTACQLLTIGAHEDAARWIDEAMRLRPHAMLALIYADTLLTHSRMDSEAGVWVAKAKQLPFEAPFPWRTWELKALDRLKQRFPNDAAIKAWHAVSRLALQELPQGVNDQPNVE